MNTQDDSQKLVELVELAKESAGVEGISASKMLEDLHVFFEGMHRGREAAQKIIDTVENSTWHDFLALPSADPYTVFQLISLIDENPNRITKGIKNLNGTIVTVTQLAKKAAKASHKEHYESNALAIREWDESGSSYSSVAAFARANYKRFSVTERTVAKWVTEHRKLAKK